MNNTAFEKLQQAKCLIGSITTADLVCMKEAQALMEALKAIKKAVEVATGGKGANTWRKKC